MEHADAKRLKRLWHTLKEKQVLGLLAILLGLLVLSVLIILMESEATRAPFIYSMF